MELLFGTLRSAIWCLLWAGISLHNVNVVAQAPTCDGVLYPTVVDFETDQAGELVLDGKVPDSFPGGLTVSGYRRESDSGNQLAIFDVLRATKQDRDFLRWREERNALIVNEYDDKSIPIINPEGGTIVFDFGQSVHQFDELLMYGEATCFGLNRKFLSLVARHSNRTIALTQRIEVNRYTKKYDLRPVGRSKYEIQQLEINYSVPLIVRSVRFTRCGPGKPTW